MFTEKAQALIDLAKDYAFSQASGELGIAPVLAAVREQAEVSVLLAECLGLAPEKLRALCPAPPAPASGPRKLPIGEPLRAVLLVARELAAEIPDPLHPGLLDLRHLACALGMSPDACALLRVTPRPRADAVKLLAAWYQA